MLYDLGVVPPSGSLLESVFMLITNRRQYTEFLKTRVLLDAALAPHIENGMEALKESFERLAKMALPHLDKTRSERGDEQKRALERWTKHKPLFIRPLWRAKEGSGARWKSSLQRNAKRRQELEEARRTGRLRRIE